MTRLRPILFLLAAVAAGSALTGFGRAADRPDGTVPPHLSGGRIAGTIELGTDGRVVRRPARAELLDRPPSALPAAEAKPPGIVRASRPSSP